MSIRYAPIAGRRFDDWITKQRICYLEEKDNQMKVVSWDGKETNANGMWTERYCEALVAEGSLSKILIEDAPDYNSESYKNSVLIAAYQGLTTQWFNETRGVWIDERDASGCQDSIRFDNMIRIKPGQVIEEDFKSQEYQDALRKEWALNPDMKRTALPKNGTTKWIPATGRSWIELLYWYKKS